MRILYAIQGTGNGHLSRAIEFMPYLQTYGKVDVLISGIQCELKFPFPVKYRLKGMSFIFGKNGGIDLIQTWKRNKIKQFLNEIRSLQVENYDLVVSDFEPISAWACKLKGKNCIGLSNQAALRFSEVPKAFSFDVIGKLILKYYAPTSQNVGFHFKAYNNQIYTPIIRSNIRNSESFIGNHYTIYLPAHSDERILEVLSKFENEHFHIFSKHSKNAYQIKNAQIHPIENTLFLESLLQSKGVITAAGFGTPSEVLFLGKKLLVVPMKNQIEQQHNAQALAEMGVCVLPDFNLNRLGKMKEWLASDKIIKVNYEDNAECIVEHVINLCQQEVKDNYVEHITRLQYL